MSRQLYFKKQRLENRSYLVAVLFLLVSGNATLFAGVPPLEFTSGHTLTLINKLLDTPRRFARVDTVEYTGFTDFQRKELVQHPAGLALAFETNSDCVYANIDYIKRNRDINAPDISTSGVSLYIKSPEGIWTFAGDNTPGANDSETFELVKNMAPGNKECLLYMPMFSVVDSVNIGVSPGSYVRPIVNPFRHRIVFHGSSFTHGASISQPAMSYVLQFERATGLHTPVLGVGGNAQLQQSWAKVLADTPADAFVLDVFSNPTACEVDDRFDSFLATIRQKHPETPIIFMQTIYRETRHFDTYRDMMEKERIDVAERKVREAMRRDRNVYFIHPDAGIGTTCDGTHPSDLGYYFWMQSIKQPILDILARYGIK